MKNTLNWITFDIETYSPSDQDRIDTSELRVTVIGAYFSWTGQYVAFLEKDATYFCDLLKEADLIIGWNHIFFDLPVMQKYSTYDLKTLPTYDIMQEMADVVGNRYKLDNVAKANLDEHKTDTYANFKTYHKEQQWGKLIDYCMNDVRLTNLIFEKALNGQPINYYDLHNKRQAILKIPQKGMKAIVGEMMESLM
jgi:DEAD/DEAH box helicase domain-containing protein